MVFHIILTTLEISVNISSLDFFPYKTQKNNSTYVTGLLRIK